MEQITRTAKQVAQTLNKSLSWVYEHAAQLGGVKIGGSWIFTEEGLTAALQATGQRERPTKVPPKRTEVAKRKLRFEPFYDTNPSAHGFHSIVTLGLRSTKDHDPEE